MRRPRGEDRNLQRLRKKARRGQRGYPLASLTFYGPDDRRASKAVVGIQFVPGAPVEEMRKGFSDTVDLRNCPDTAAEALAYMEAHGVLSVAMVEGIFGCPHEEGIDYEGDTCPQCPFWAGRDRFAAVGL